VQQRKNSVNDSEILGVRAEPLLSVSATAEALISDDQRHLDAVDTPPKSETTENSYLNMTTEASPPPDNLHAMVVWSRRNEASLSLSPTIWSTLRLLAPLVGRLAWFLAVNVVFATIRSTLRLLATLVGSVAWFKL
ncbi:unnamed protein product, partial [Laminaria digitata]